MAYAYWKATSYTRGSDPTRRCPINLQLPPHRLPLTLPPGPRRVSDFLRFDAQGLAQLSVALVSTHTPRQCGIATFTSDLAEAIRRADPDIRTTWAAVDEAQSTHSYGPEVHWRIRQGCPDSYAEAAVALNNSDVDVVSLQHEFGLYGIWGETFDDHLETFLDVLEKPLVVTLHTVLPNPSPSVRDAVQRIGRRSDAIMAMAGRARAILEQEYGLDPAKVHVIPHGVPPMGSLDREAAKAELGLSGRRVISTFGFVDPRKGLEYMIEAMADVVRRHPDTLYMLLGRTHPDLARYEGEKYRGGLVDLVASRGLEGHVVFIDRYLSQEQILNYLVASDIYVTPYLDPNQITSGTLSYALGAGKAIVSTRYAHAVEALADRRGLLVDFRSAEALARAVTDILDSEELRAELERNATQYGAQMAWPSIGRRVAQLYRSVTAAAARTGAEQPLLAS